MPVIIKPTSTIKVRLGIQEGGPAHKYLTHVCRLHMDKYVPYRRGILRTTATENVDSIIYDQPYARYMYFGKKMVMDNGKSAFYNENYGFWSKKGEKKTLTDEDLVYHEAGTGPYWDERMKGAEIDEVVKEVQDWVNTHGGK